MPEARVAPDARLSPLIFDAIDLAAGQARFIGNAGATDVTVAVADNGLQFVERTGSGTRAPSRCSARRSRTYVADRRTLMIALQPAMVAPSQMKTDTDSSWCCRAAVRLALFRQLFNTACAQ